LIYTNPHAHPAKYFIDECRTLGTELLEWTKYELVNDVLNLGGGRFFGTAESQQDHID